MKLLVFSHAHPRFIKGGGELAAYYLHEAVNRLGLAESRFVARAAPGHLPPGVPLHALAPGEYLVAGNADGMALQSTLSLTDDGELAGLLRDYQPEVVHFHHYYLLGVELLRLVRRICPRAKIVMTLHEFLAICINHGQMVKSNGQLCHRYAPRECHQCHPERSPEWIFGRERYVKSFFGLVDLFIAPSHFLRDRYVAWGLDPARVQVMENGLPEGGRIAPRALRPGERRGRFAYFGQITAFKGVDLLLDAFASLPAAVREHATLDVFGGGLQAQKKEFREKIAQLAARAGDAVRLHGAYEPEEMPRLMADTDWVVMGSIWWENSPLVIQEAYKYGRPVLCPDIGGMAEKVEPGVGGYHFRARDSSALRALVARLVEDPALFDEAHRQLPGFSSSAQSARAHLDAYARVPERHVEA